MSTAINSERLDFIYRITGIEPDRATEAREKCRGYGLARVDDTFLAATDIDSVVASTLLHESVEELCKTGVPRNKLMSKLRSGDDAWVEWCEIRAAAIVAKSLESEYRFEMEPAKASGKHADFRIVTVDGTEPLSIEFKAVGRSDSELSFMKDAQPLLEAMLPPVGLATGHSPSRQLSMPSRQQRRKGFRESAKKHRQTRKTFSHWPDMRGSCVVGYGFDAQYGARLRARVLDAIGQLPKDEESWVAFWWSNGAPSSALPRLLHGLELPENIRGLIVIGMGIAFPWPDIHVIQAWLPRELIEEEPVPPEQALAEMGVVSNTHDDDLARRVIERFESASGTRAFLLESMEGEGGPLLRRDGTRRLDPFNLIFDADPRSLAGGVRPLSPVQDVRVQ